MSEGQAPAQKPVMTVTEMDGRISELERQRDAAQARCAILAGTNALLLKTLGEARGEIERLNGLIPQAPAVAAETGEAPQAPTLN